MTSSKTIALLRAIYDEVHLALWAALMALVIYFSTFVAPRLPQARATAERIRLEEIGAEDQAFCAKWGMGRLTAMNGQCLLNLEEFRTKVEERIARDNDLL